jgi:hypothetical protein
LSSAPRELRGLEIFLAEPETTPPSSDALRRGGIGNLPKLAIPRRAFTDFGCHNTGAAQAVYDGLHGLGAFMTLSIPDLATRQRNFDAYLPPTPPSPDGAGPIFST